MKILIATLAAAFALSLLLTWLLFRSGPNIAEYFEISHALDEVAVNEAVLHRGVLTARAGLVQDYDPLVKAVDDLRASAARLRKVLKGVTEPKIARIEAAVAVEEALTERFKTDNAVLQNSLAYLDLLGARVEDLDPRLSTEVSAATGAVIHLTREASPDVTLSVLHRLDELAAEKMPPPIADDLGTFILHARLLADRLPKVDETLRRLLATSTEADREAIRMRFGTRRLDQESRAQCFRIALYLVALVLLGLLIRFGFKLRAGAFVQRKRGELEHLLAEVSNRFIACQPEDIQAEFSVALGALGRVAEADRVYVILPEDPQPVRIWCAPGRPAPPGWPEALLDIMPTIAAIPEVSMRLSAASREHVPAALSDTIAAAGVSAWSCAKLFRDDRFVGLICYDRSAMPALWLKETVGILRMTATVISNVLLRQYHYHERRDMEARLQHAHRLERLGTFTSGVAHNFNNVIGAMMGHAEMASDALTMDTPPARHVEQIIRAGERARELVGQILDFGRGGDTLPRPVPVDALVAEAVSQAEAALPPQIELVVTGDAAGACVMGEAAQLQQVLVNLIRNGAQASEPGSRITVSIDERRLEKPLTLSHGVLAPGAYVRLRVTDQGCGIEAATLSEIFRPFFTTRPAGTGLGLATAREVVHDRGGAFDVYSIPGSGSTFEVYLPLVSLNDRCEQASRLGRGETVLLLGADRSIIMRDEEMLAAFGYEPVAFLTADAALAAIQANPRRFDVMIVEQTLVNASGLEFAAAARRHAAGRPIILSSNAPERLPADSLAAARVADVIRRPWRSGLVATALARCLSQASDQSPTRRAG